jgi:hypothetical protein
MGNWSSVMTSPKVSIQVGSLACVTMLLFSARALSQDAVAETDAEPIVYAAAPKFWEEVERVMRSDLKLY